MNSHTHFTSWIALHWKSGAVVACAVGIAATLRWCLETDEVRGQRAQRKNKKELHALAEKISTYGRNVHQRYPTWDTKSPKGSPERILEAKRVISIAVLFERERGSDCDGHWNVCSLAYADAGQ